MLLLLAGFPKGDLTAVPLGGSMGDVLAVEDPDRGWVAEICGRWLRFIWWSGFGEGAIMYYQPFSSAERCSVQGQSRCDTWGRTVGSSTKRGTRKSRGIDGRQRTWARRGSVER